MVRISPSFGGLCAGVWPGRQPSDAAQTFEWCFQKRVWLYTAVLTSVLTLHKQLLATSLPLGSFIIFASKACKSFMDSVHGSTGANPQLPSLSSPVGIGHRIQQALSPLREAGYQVLHSTLRVKQASIDRTCLSDDHLNNYIYIH